MNPPIGTRVGAMLSADRNVVRFLGYGVYEGNHLPPDAEAILDRLCEDTRVFVETALAQPLEHMMERERKLMALLAKVEGRPAPTEDEVRAEAESVRQRMQTVLDTEGGLEACVRTSPAYTNPRIRLDSGKVVWGKECWWGPEDSVRAQIAAAPEVIHVDIDEVRAKHTACS